MSDAESLGLALFRRQMVAYGVEPGRADEAWLDDGVRTFWCNEATFILAAITSSAAIDAAHIEHQRAWSSATFGPRAHRGPVGPLDHVRKEVEEVAADPYDLGEWVDLIILALDGAWRAGHEPQAIIDAVKAKQAENEARTWPDWRGLPADEAIEHVRETRS